MKKPIFSKAGLTLLLLGIAITPVLFMFVKMLDTQSYEQATELLEKVAEAAESPVDMVAYWKFDEGSGTTAANASGNEHAGIVSGATWITGKIGKAISLDGIDDSVNAGSAGTLDAMPAFTVSAWINPSSLGEQGKGRIVAKAAGMNLPSKGWAFYLTNEVSGGIKFSVDHEKSHLERMSVANAVKLNQWQHVVVTWDGTAAASNAHIFVNGVEVVYGASMNGEGARSLDSVQDLLIGNNPAKTRTFKGGIDEVRIYKRVLNATEIQALATGSGTTTPTTPPSTGGGNTPPTPTTPPGAGGSNTSIWKPALNTSWQWQLTGLPVDQNVNVLMFDIDLFENDAAVISSLHSKGKKVICYFSAGSWEDWRPDASQFPAAVKGANNGWPGEKWLDIRNLSVLGPIMKARLDVAVQKGCDGVEPDNIDGYTNKTGFPLTGNDQLTYNKFLADEAHARNLSIGLKNDIDQAVALQPYFDWALNEQCFQYKECDTLLPFINAGKAVFNVEYTLTTSQFCSQANSMNFNSLKKNLDLDASRTACR